MKLVCPKQDAINVVKRSEDTVGEELIQVYVKFVSAVDVAGQNLAVVVSVREANICNHLIRVCTDAFVAQDYYSHKRERNKRYRESCKVDLEPKAFVVIGAYRLITRIAVQGLVIQINH